MIIAKLKLASRKYFRKTAGSSNNSRDAQSLAGAESDMYGQPRVWTDHIPAVNE